MSEHKTLHEALCAVQREAETLPKDAVNPHYRSKFTPLDTIVERVGPLLAKHGLTWSTFPCYGPDGSPALRYKLTHAATGDSESETMPLLVVKADPQGLGSAVTYGRRYSITAVLNLVADEDDDGNSHRRDQHRQPAAAAGLSDQSFLAVKNAISVAKPGAGPLLTFLRGLGVDVALDAPITEGTLRSLTERQATAVVTWCGDVQSHKLTNGAPS